MYLCQKTYVPMSKNFCAYVHKKLMCLCAYVKKLCVSVLMSEKPYVLMSEGYFAPSA